MSERRETNRYIHDPFGLPLLDQFRTSASALYAGGYQQLPFQQQVGLTPVGIPKIRATDSGALSITDERKEVIVPESSSHSGTTKDGNDPGTVSKIDEAADFGEKPKRALSAYNYFLKEERQKIISEHKSRKRISSTTTKTNDDRSSKRARLKMDGESGEADDPSFENIGKLIGRRWKEVKADRKLYDKYNKLAGQDKKRHDAEMEIFNKKKEKVVGTLSASKTPATIPPPSSPEVFDVPAENQNKDLNPMLIGNNNVFEPKSNVIMNAASLIGAYQDTLSQQAALENYIRAGLLRDPGCAVAPSSGLNSLQQLSGLSSFGALTNHGLGLLSDPRTSPEDGSYAPFDQSNLVESIDNRIAVLKARIRARSFMPR